MPVTTPNRTPYRKGQNRNWQNPPPRRPAPRRREDWYAMRRRRRRHHLARGLVMAACLCVVAGAVLLLLPSLMQQENDAACATAAAPTHAPAPPAAAQTDPRPVVAIDPGHGGADPGSEGLGFDEYEMTWATANALYDLLEQDGRLRPYLTLSEEESQNHDIARIRPSERAQRANEAGAALLLSIHGNSDPIYDASGYECYAIPPGNANHEESVRFAEYLTAQFSSLGQRLRGENGIRYLYYGENDEQIMTESSDETVSSNPTFGVLEYAACPAVLSEQCFITNSADVDLLGDADGCETAAGLYYNAICAWFGLEPAV